MVILAILAVGGYLWFSIVKDPNNLNRVYTATDFPLVQGKTGSGDNIKQLNTYVQKLQTDTQLDIETRYTYWNEIGVRKLSLQDYQGAKAAWEKAVAINPKNALALANLGNLYKSFLKDYGRSEKYYLLALEANADTEPYFQDYEGLADLYLIFDTAKADKVSPLIESGLAKATGSNRLPFYVYLAQYYKTRDQVKYELNKAEALKIDPNIKDQI